LQGQFDQERREVEELAFDIDGRLRSCKFHSNKTCEAPEMKSSTQLTLYELT
jgi:phage tail tube protein FII